MSAATILLADDHAVVRAGIRKAIEDLPDVAIVGEVGDGRSLLAALAAQPPDCLLIDVTMPAFEPISTIRHIRQRYPALRILVVSAYDDDVYVQGLLSAGVDGYHLKDQPLSDLRLAVQRVLQGERWISSPLLDKLVSASAAPPAVPSPGSPSLSPRQQEILQLLVTGLDNRMIARQLGLSIKTVENHLTRLYRQLDVQSRLEAVCYVNDNPDVLAAGRGASASLPGAGNGATARTTILVVDDNQRYRRQLRRMIGRACTLAMIHEAADTEEAVAIAGQQRPCIAFVDVVLADESGIHCTRRLKHVLPGLRVVLISAYPDREFHREGLEAGAAAFLDKKDLDSAALKHIIEDMA